MDNEYMGPQQAKAIIDFAEKTKRIKRKELAEKVGVTYTSLTRYYCGYTNMPVDVYNKIKKYADSFTV